MSQDTTTAEAPTASRPHVENLKRRPTVDGKSAGQPNLRQLSSTSTQPSVGMGFFETRYVSVRAPSSVLYGQSIKYPGLFAYVVSRWNVRGGSAAVYATLQHSRISAQRWSNETSASRVHAHVSPQEKGLRAGADSEY